MGFEQDTGSCIQSRSGLTDRVTIKKGVRQGCLVSPMCFNFYSEVILQSVNELCWVGVKISGVRMNNLRFADL